MASWFPVSQILEFLCPLTGPHSLPWEAPENAGDGLSCTHMPTSGSTTLQNIGSLSLVYFHGTVFFPS